MIVASTRSKSASGGLLAAFAAVSLSLALGVALTVRPSVGLLVGALTVVVVTAIASAASPLSVWVLAVGLLAIVPYYAPPSFGGEPLVPAAAIFWLLGITLLLREGVPRIRAADLCVAWLVLIMVIDVLLDL